MIRELRIKNLALIEDLSLEFQTGFTVFTGETGAGKSILMGAIGLLLGERASSEMIRSGSEEGEVSGVFEIKSIRPRLERFLKDSGIDAEDGILIIRRKLSKNDKNRIHVNQIPIPLSSLKKLGDMLIDLHGQHQHQSLLDESTHIHLINSLPGVPAVLEIYRKNYNNFTETQDQLESARKRARELAEKKDILEFQYNELKNLNLHSREEDKLEDELKLLSSSAERISCATDIINLLNPPEGDSLQRTLATIKKKLDNFSRFDSSVEPWITDVDSIISICSELDLFCTSYLEKEGTESNQKRIEEINSRLSKIQRLKKKYSCSVDELITKKSQLEQSLYSLSNSESDLQYLEKEVTKSKQECLKAGKILTQARIDASEQFDKEITRRMTHLGFKGGLWKSEFLSLGEPCPEGLESVRFLVRTNPGEPLLPLAKSASGGEVSRLMLAIKSILAELDDIPVLIFDEIDTGIGGVLAKDVSKALLDLSSTHQVLCISHLHQIASSADHHFRVQKGISDDRTITTVEQLDPKQRIDEIARMLGGDSRISREHAQELLKKSET